MNFKKLKIEGSLVFNDPVSKQMIRDCAKHKRVELDLKDVVCMDSIGVDLIVKLANELRKKNGNLRIVNIRPELKSVFDMVGIDYIAEVM